MRRFTKLLSVLFVLAMLFALTVTAVSAAQSDEEGLVTGYQHLAQASQDFQNAEFDVYGPTNTKNTTAGFIGEAGIGNRMGRVTVAKYGINKYLQYHHLNHDLPTSYGTSSGEAGYYGLKLGGYGNTDSFAYGIVNYDYVTLDFELCSDSYLDSNKILTDENTGELAYAPVNLTLISRFYNAAKGGALEQTQNNTNVAMAIKKVGGAWCIVHTATNAKYELPAEVGMWTHISYVIDIDNTVNYSDGTVGDFDASRAEEITGFNFNNTKVHIYVNGEYLSTMESIFKPAVDEASSHVNLSLAKMYVNGFGFDQVRFQGAYSDLSQTDFSFGIDNVSVNYYPKGYVGELADFIAADPTLPIYSCDDVVYTGSYQIPAPNLPVANLTKTDGEKIGYYIVSGALDSLASGDTIELFADSKLPYNASFPFTIIHNGNDFTLSPETDYIVSDHAEDGKYSVRKALSADYADVIWDYKGDLYEVTTCIGGQVPVCPHKNIEPKLEGGAYKIFLGWSTDKDATEPMEIPAVEPSSELVLYPVYQVLDFKFAMYNADGSLYVPKAGIEAYGNADNFYTILNEFPSGATMKLLSDVSIPSGSSVTIGAKKSLAIDVNGYTLSKYDNNANANMFKLNNKSSIHIYSSCEGGEVVKIAYSSKIRGSGLVYALNTNGCDIKFGNGTDNLTVNAPLLVDVNGAKYTGSLPTNYKINLTIDGGTYVRNHSDSYAFIIARDMLHLDIKNANLYSFAANLFSCDGRYVGAFTGTIDNCDIAAPNGSIFSIFLDGSNVTITNSNLAGKISFNPCTEPGIPENYPAWAKSKGVVTLGEGTRYYTNIVPDGTNILVDGVPTVETEESVVSFSYYEFSYSAGQFSYTEKEYKNKHIFTSIAAAAPAIENAPAVENLPPIENNVEAEAPVNTPSITGTPENAVVTEAPKNEIATEFLPAAEELEVKAPVVLEVKDAPATSENVTVKLAPTFAEILITYIKSFLRLAALPVTKNTLFII